MKSSGLVPKTTRDSQSVDPARAAAGSVTSETATIDIHPIILDDSEEDTDRFVDGERASDASSSGVTNRNVRSEPAPTIVDVEEEVDLSALEATLTEPREAKRANTVPRFEEETKPIPKPNLGDIAGALETVPLSAALVQNVLAQVDARAAARESGKPVPPLSLSPVRPYVPPPAPAIARSHPQTTVSSARQAPPRRTGVELAITVIAFLVVAVPAFYWLYVTYVR